MRRAYWYFRLWRALHRALLRVRPLAPQAKATFTQLQRSFRIRTADTGLLNAAFPTTPALNANATISTGTKFRVRFAIQETTGGTANNTYRLWYSRNGGAYALVDATTPVQVADSSFFADGDLTSKLLDGTGTFVAGVGDDADNLMPSAGNISMAANGNTEVEICLLIDAAQVANNDTIALRVRTSDGAVLNGGYTNTPTITVSKIAAPVSVNASPALLTTAAQVVSPQVATPPVSITATPATLTTSAEWATPLSGAFEWWNATTQTWVATEHFNTGTAGSHQFPANAWANGSYGWTVATQDQDGATGPYAAEFTLTVGGAGGVTVTASPATISTSAQAASPQRAALAISVAVATTAVAAQAADVARGALVVTASPASITTSARVANPLVSGNAVVVSADPASLATQAQPPSPQQAPFSASASPAIVATAAQVANPQAGTPPVTVVASPASLTTNAQAADPVEAPLAIPASPASLTTSAQAVTAIVAGAPVAIITAPALLGLDAQTVNVVRAATLVQAQPALVALSSHAGTIFTAPFSLNATAATVSVAAPAVFIVAGEKRNIRIRLSRPIPKWRTFTPIGKWGHGKPERVWDAGGLER